MTRRTAPPSPRSLPRISTSSESPSATNARRSTRSSTSCASILDLVSKLVAPLTPAEGRNAIEWTVLGMGYLGVWAARDQSLCGLGACSSSPFHRSVLTGMSCCLPRCRTRRTSRTLRQGAARAQLSGKNASRALADGRRGRCHSRLGGHPSRNSSRSPRGLNPTTGAGSRQS